MKLLKNCLFFLWVVVSACVAVSCSDDDSDPMFQRVSEIYIDGQLNYTIDYDEKGRIATVSEYTYRSVTPYCELTYIRNESGMVKKIEYYRLQKEGKEKYYEREFRVENGYYMADKGNIWKHYINPASALTLKDGYYYQEWDNINLEYWDCNWTGCRVYPFSDTTYFKASYFEGLFPLSPDFLLGCSAFYDGTDNEFRYLQHLAAGKVPLKGNGYIQINMIYGSALVNATYSYDVEYVPKANQVRFTYTMDNRNLSRPVTKTITLFYK